MATPRNVLSALSSVQWGQKHRWEVILPLSDIGSSLPAPFTDFAPAQSITFTHVSLQDRDIDVGGKGYKVPSGKSATQMTITMFDDTYDSILQYFTAWTDYMHTGGIATVGEAKRLILYHRLDNANSIMHTYAVEVIPTGDIQTDSDDTNSVRTVAISFNILSMQEQ